MKVKMDCVPCYLKQVLSAIKMGKCSEEVANQVFNYAMRIIPELDTAASPGENSTLVLLEAYEAMGIKDPFKQAKIESNKLAESLYPNLEKIVIDLFCL